MLYVILIGKKYYFAFVFNFYQSHILNWFLFYLPESLYIYLLKIIIYLYDCY